MRKKINQFLILCFLLIGGLHVSAQVGNEFLVSDPNINYPSNLEFIRAKLNADNKYVFAIIQNNNAYNQMAGRNYTAFSVDRTEVMGDRFDGTMYVSHFSLDGRHVETFALRPNETKRYYTGTAYGFARDGYLVYKNYGGQYGGIVDGGFFSFRYEGSFTPVRSGNAFISDTFKIPTKIKQRITYIDETTGNRIAVEENQEGIMGQAFNTKQKLIDGYYIPVLPRYTPGFLSPYKAGYSFRKQSSDNLYIYYEQINDEGYMNITAYNNGRLVFKRDNVAPNIKGLYFYYGNGYRYDVSNPYIPQTSEIVYRYRRIARIVYTSRDSSFPTSSKPYTSNPADVRKVLDEKVPEYTGWEAYYKGKRIQEGTYITIENPGVDTEIEYRRRKIARVNPSLRVRVK